MKLDDKQVWALAKLLDAINNTQSSRLRELLATRNVAKIKGDDHPINVLCDALDSHLPK